MIQLAWRFLDYQKESALAKWFQARTENARGSRKKMIVALARKLLIALWHFIRDGVVPEGVVAPVPHTEGRSPYKHLTVFAPSARVRDRSPMTVRGGGAPRLGLVLTPSRRMGPPPRSFAAMRITASWVRVSAPAAYKDVARMFVHHSRASLGLSSSPTTPRVVLACSEPSSTSLFGGC